MAIQEHTRRLNHCLSESALHSDSWYHDRLAESSAGGLLHLLQVLGGELHYLPHGHGRLPQGISLIQNGAFPTSTILAPSF